MGKVRARQENGKLFLDFRYQGDRCREQTALDDTPKNRKIVEQLLAKIENEIEEGTFDYAATFPASARAVKYAKSSATAASSVTRQTPPRAAGDDTDRTPRVREFAETWFQQMKPEWRPSYQETILVTLNRYLLPKFGNQRVGSITRANLLDFRAELCAIERPKGKLSNARINKILGIMRKLLGEAGDRFDFTNPAIGIKALRKTKTDIQPFSLEEVRRILDAVRADYQPYLAVRFYTGMRTGEINALRWRDIDMDNALILVRNTLYKGELQEGAKTEGSVRDIPMIPQVLEALQRQREIVSREIECIERQLFWPVDDNYFGRLPLSLAACSFDPQRGSGWRPPSNRSKYSWMSDQEARTRLQRQRRQGFPSAPVVGSSAKAPNEGASHGIGEPAPIRLRRSGMRSPSDWGRSLRLTH